MQKPVGHLVFALHSHLPFVLNHGRWPHGSDWLSEVTVECYLPLLRVLGRLARDEIGHTVTINISPILAEQLASAAFRGELVAYLEQRRQICSETRRYFSDSHDDDLVALCDYWSALYEGLERDFEEMNGDLLGQFRAYADRGTIELISTGATHGYFPLLSRDESIDLQLRVAGATHRRHFGRAPRGLWLPECAYRPRYEWTPPVGPRSGKVRYKRRGVEELLAAHSLEYFFTDIHLVRGGQALSAYRDYFPRLRSVVGSEGQFYRRENRSPYAPYRVASRGGTGDAVAFVRDPETTLQVWSRDAGYPGDAWYLEFHKRHFPGGLRFWRVTHPKSDLADKQIYVPERAEERTRAHAAHFTEVVRNVLVRYAEETGRTGVLCSPFDTELFGHWWAEGPSWLEHVFRGLGAQGIAAMTAGSHVEDRPAEGPITLLEGSWGEGGDHRVWLNKDTAWTWEIVYQAEDELWGFVSRMPWQRAPLLRRIVAQMAREMLLLAGLRLAVPDHHLGVRNYAETRFAEHYADFTPLGTREARVWCGGWGGVGLGWGGGGG